MCGQFHETLLRETIRQHIPLPTDAKPSLQVPELEMRLEQYLSSGNEEVSESHFSVEAGTTVGGPKGSVHACTLVFSAAGLTHEPSFIAPCQRHHTPGLRVLPLGPQCGIQFLRRRKVPPFGRQVSHCVRKCAHSHIGDQPLVNCLACLNLSISLTQWGHQHFSYLSSRPTLGYSNTDWARHHYLRC